MSGKEWGLLAIIVVASAVAVVAWILCATQGSTFVPAIAMTLVAVVVDAGTIYVWYKVKSMEP